MLLEAKLQPEGSSFITLTYNDEHEPLVLDEVDATPVGTLRKSDLTKFFKRLRNEGHKFRYYAVGEYGERTQRPHYHAVLFGIPPVYEEEIAAKWPHGHIKVDDFTPERGAYVAAYTAKKLIAQKQELGRRVPEYSVMSRNPGIGFPFIEYLAEAIKRADDRVPESDIALLYHGIIRTQGKFWPLDKEMRKRLNSAFIHLNLLPERSEHSQALETHLNYWQRYLSRDEYAELQQTALIEKAERKHQKFVKLNHQARL